MAAYARGFAPSSNRVQSQPTPTSGRNPAMAPYTPQPRSSHSVGMVGRHMQAGQGQGQGGAPPPHAGHSGFPRTASQFNTPNAVGTPESSSARGGFPRGLQAHNTPNSMRQPFSPAGDKSLHNGLGGTPGATPSTAAPASGRRAQNSSSDLSQISPAAKGWQNMDCTPNGPGPMVTPSKQQQPYAGTPPSTRQPWLQSRAKLTGNVPSMMARADVASTLPQGIAYGSMVRSTCTEVRKWQDSDWEVANRYIQPTSLAARKPILRAREIPPPEYDYDKFRDDKNFEEIFQRAKDKSFSQIAASIERNAWHYIVGRFMEYGVVLRHTHVEHFGAKVLRAFGFHTVHLVMALQLLETYYTKVARREDTWHRDFIIALKLADDLHAFDHDQPLRGTRGFCEKADEILEQTGSSQRFCTDGKCEELWTATAAICEVLNWKLHIGLDQFIQFTQKLINETKRGQVATLSISRGGRKPTSLSPDGRHNRSDSTLLSGGRGGGRSPGPMGHSPASGPGMLGRNGPLANDTPMSNAHNPRTPGGDDDGCKQQLFHAMQGGPRVDPGKAGQPIRARATITNPLGCSKQDPKTVRPNGSSMRQPMNGAARPSVDMRGRSTEATGHGPSASQVMAGPSTGVSSRLSGRVQSSPADQRGSAPNHPERPNISARAGASPMSRGPGVAPPRTMPSAGAGQGGYNPSGVSDNTPRPGATANMRQSAVSTPPSGQQNQLRGPLGGGFQRMQNPREASNSLTRVQCQRGR